MELNPLSGVHGARWRAPAASACQKELDVQLPADSSQLGTAFEPRMTTRPVFTTAKAEGPVDAPPPLLSQPRPDRQDDVRVRSTFEGYVRHFGLQPGLGAAELEGCQVAALVRGDDGRLTLKLGPYETDNGAIRIGGSPCQDVEAVAGAPLAWLEAPLNVDGRTLEVELDQFKQLSGRSGYSLARRPDLGALAGLQTAVLTYPSFEVKTGVLLPAERPWEFRLGPQGPTIKLTDALRVAFVPAEEMPPPPKPAPSPEQIDRFGNLASRSGYEILRGEPRLEKLRDRQATVLARSPEGDWLVHEGKAEKAGPGEVKIGATTLKLQDVGMAGVKLFDHERRARARESFLKDHPASRYHHLEPDGDLSMAVGREVTLLTEYPKIGTGILMGRLLEKTDQGDLIIHSSMMDEPITTLKDEAVLLALRR